MREQLRALKPPFWLLSLPLFIVLYRNTATSTQGKDKRVNGEDNVAVDVAGNGNGEKRDDGDAKDKREYGEGKQQI